MSGLEKEVVQEQTCSCSSIERPPFCLLYYRKTWGKSAGTDKILFRPVTGTGASLGVVQGAEIFARAPEKCLCPCPRTGPKHQTGH